jgi:ubiquinone/menaquinone biosynthesis C-methylase UbiE
MAVDEASGYRFGYDRDELERLGHQHGVWSRHNRLLLERAGFRAGMTVVDLGCGPGHTTLEIARLVGPNGHVIAVDRDGQRSLRMLESRLAGEHLTNVETRAADLQQFDLAPGSVDGVYGRWVLMYLPIGEVQALLGRIARWLRPGGTFVSAEFCNFHNMRLYPPSALLPTVVEALYQSVAGERGCCPEIGNLIPGLLRREGLEVQLSVATMAVQAGTPEWQWPDGPIPSFGATCPVSSARTASPQSSSGRFSRTGSGAPPMRIRSSSALPSWRPWARRGRPGRGEVGVPDLEEVSQQKQDLDEPPGVHLQSRPR